MQKHLVVSHSHIRKFNLNSLLKYLISRYPSSTVQKKLICSEAPKLFFNSLNVFILAASLVARMYTRLFSQKDLTFQIMNYLYVNWKMKVRKSFPQNNGELWTTKVKCSNQFRQTGKGYLSSSHKSTSLQSLILVIETALNFQPQNWVNVL